MSWARSARPIVEMKDREMVKNRCDQMKERGVRRRGGIGCNDQSAIQASEDDIEKDTKKKYKEPRYPECRGLRFCTETRMYYPCRVAT